MATPSPAKTHDKQHAHAAHSKSAPTSPRHTTSTPHTPNNTPVMYDSTYCAPNQHNKRKYDYESVVYATKELKTMKLQHSHTYSCVLYTLVSVLLLLCPSVSAQTSALLGTLGTVGSSLVGDALSSTLGSNNALTTGYNTVSSDLGSLVSSASAVQQLSGGTASTATVPSLSTPALPSGSTGTSSALPTLSSAPQVPTTFLATDPLGLSNVNSMFADNSNGNYSAVYQSQVSIIDYNDPNVWRIVFVAQQPVQQVVLHYVVQQLSDTTTPATLAPSGQASAAVQSLSSGAMETLSMIDSAATAAGGMSQARLTSLRPYAHTDSSDVHVQAHSSPRSVLWSTCSHLLATLCQPGSPTSAHST